MEWTNAYFDRIMEAFSPSLTNDGVLFKFKNSEINEKQHSLTQQCSLDIDSDPAQPTLELYFKTKPNNKQVRSAIDNYTYRKTPEKAHKFWHFHANSNLKR